MELKTDKGLVYQLDEEMLGDMEVFENLVEIEKGNPVSLPGTVKTLIGEDGYEQLKESCRNEKGRVPIVDFMTAFGELIRMAGAEGSKKN